MTALSISVTGAGLVGRRHIDAMAGIGDVHLHSVVDPSDASGDLAASLGVPWFRDLDAMIASGAPDGVILATPNQVHVETGLTCIAAGLPTLLEKPIATDVAAGKVLADAAADAGVPMAIGHHRRHNPLIAKAKAIIDDGQLGTLVAVHGSFLLMKPDDYFAEAEWRARPGAGPILVNLIHDIDLLRHLVGDVVSVQAQQSNIVRGNAVEETAVVILRFANGALGTMTVSDAVVAPWSWELTAAENPAYPATDEACYMIAGTHGSLDLPHLKLWTHSGAHSWWEPISATRFPVSNEDPLVRQIRQFMAVIRGEEQPLVSALEGLKSLQVIDAIKTAAETGETVTLDPLT